MEEQERLALPRLVSLLGSDCLAFPNERRAVYRSVVTVVSFTPLEGFLRREGRCSCGQTSVFLGYCPLESSLKSLRLSLLRTRMTPE